MPNGNRKVEILDVVAEYALLHVPESVLDELIKERMTRNEKIGLLLNADNTRLLAILEQLGCKPSFLTTLQPDNTSVI